MTLALVDELAAATAQLRGAMQQAELSDIEKAVARFREAMGAIEETDAARPDPLLKARVAEMIGELQSSRALALLMGDLAGRAHAAFAAEHMDAPQAIYGPR